MTDATLPAQVLDSLTDPVLVADTEHTVVYMNSVAVDHYTGGEALMGTSLLDCHNEHSRKMMIEVLAALRAGEEERLISDDEKRRIYMRAVRDEAGELVGYYERYEWKDA
jgi:nitrogen-specific signal transduction histidine kinase